MGASTQAAGWAPAPWFLVTPPQQARDAIDRPRTVALLDALVTRRVALLTAPAGFGKTSVVAEWARHAPEPVGWLSLTRFDEHAEHLLLGLASALHRLAAESGDRRFAPLRTVDPDPHDLAMSYRALVGALDRVTVPVVVVLDDVHLLGARAAEGILGMLVEHAPAALRLVLVGRHPPDLPLHRLRVAGQLGEITAADLAFTGHEIRRAAWALGSELGTHEADAILAGTGGWPAAVRLALVGERSAASHGADAVPQSGPAGPGRPAAIGELPAADSRLADYVVEEILAGLRPALARFVLDATTCELLGGRLAAALTGDERAPELLEECRRLGLFLDRFTEPGSEPVYRWHAVFAEQCRTILVSHDPARADRLDRVAARELAARYPLQAIVHAQRGHDPELATRIIAEHWLEIVLRSDSAALEQLCLALPAGWSESPAVLLARACCRTLGGDRPAAATLLTRADAAADLAGRSRAGAVPAGTAGAGTTARPGTSAQGADGALGHYPIARSLAALLLADEHAELRAACDRVVQLLRAPAGWDPPTHAAATFLLGWIELRLRRDPPRAVALLGAAQTECRTTGQEVVANRAAVNSTFALAYVGEFAAAREGLAALLGPDADLDSWTSVEGGIEWLTDGFVAYWQDDLDRAVRRLRVLAERPDAPGGGPGAVGRGYFGNAAAADGRPELLAEAGTLLREPTRGELHGVPLHIYPEMGRVLVALAGGRRRRARALLDAIPRYAQIRIVIAQAAEAYRQLGDRAAAAARLAGLLGGGQPSYVAASAWTTRALIEFTDGDVRAARTALDRALALATPESVRRPFVGTDPVLRELLSVHAARGTRHTEFVADCLARCELAVARRAGAGGPLSRRELEIVGYLRTTMTVAEIAAAMGLSVNTVKTHLRVTYRKLGVTNRREAVRVTT